MTAMSRLLSALAAAILAAASAAAQNAAQDAAQDASPAQDAERARMDGLLEKAVRGSAVIRPQAAARLVAFGEPAIERLLALSEGTPAATAKLGADLVEAFGAFGDARLRALLWRCIEDRDFPWRPAAARSLAAHPSADAREAEPLTALLADPIAPVRMAAVQGLHRLFEAPPDAQRSAVRARLADPSDFVRRAAAVALCGWGEPEALLWLVEDLQRTDTFFERWSGKNAAYESRRALGELLGDTFGYDPETPPTTEANQAALTRLRAAVDARIGDRPRPALPAVALAAPPVTDAVLGLELVSCRRGEHYLAWTRDDHLLIGMGNPTRLALPPGTVARLLTLAEAQLARVERPFFGTPGCDLEMLRHVPAPGTPPRTFIVSKGEAKVEGLRPEPLGELLRALVASIPDEPLRTAAAETMAAVGGP